MTLKFVKEYPLFLLVFVIASIAPWVIGAYRNAEPINYADMLQFGRWIPIGAFVGVVIRWTLQSKVTRTVRVGVLAVMIALAILELFWLAA